MARREIRITGIVQGVGFRPLVYQLAVRHRLKGNVRNQTTGVLIAVEGREEDLDRFIGDLAGHPPPLARIEKITSRETSPGAETEFVILSSEETGSGAFWVSPDIAPCEECAAELLDPSDRRHRYPFLNCTHCGPRLTVIRRLPYDRERTTLAAFPMCGECQLEYDNPLDRRFHAQPTACPRCGPRLELNDRQGKRIEADDSLSWVLNALREGRIGALKGAGGFHLMCDATNPVAVEELRKRKKRDAKPFAIMAGSRAEAEKLCRLTELGARLLESIQRPIVVLPRREGAAVADEAAPGTATLGLMLPSTPLHLLLMRDWGGPLIMTSGNVSADPIEYEDDAAFERLGEVADFFLTHNRPIRMRCDDSLLRADCGREIMIRRARGYVPLPAHLAAHLDRPILAVGGQMKAVFALGHGDWSVLSQHLGDLDGFAAFQAYQDAIAHFEELFQFVPERIAHDMHPDYASTRYAVERAKESGAELVPVQHHHAHLASCMADNGLAGRVIGVIFDGTGMGLDGAVWGGEFLVGGYGGFERAGHLRYTRLPGGEQAVREPWRMAVSYLRDAGLEVEGWERWGRAEALIDLIERGIQSPWTSSCGRLFDAVAALLGVCCKAEFEAQGAMQLEWLAARASGGDSYEFTIEEQGGQWVADMRLMIRELAREQGKGGDCCGMARRFHLTLAEMIRAVCLRVRDRFDLNKVVLSGGVFVNGLLLGETIERLTPAGFQVYTHREIPCNDGGLSLGQLTAAGHKQ